MPSASGNILLEAETAQRSGLLSVSQSAPGFSGTGYVTGFETDNEKLTFAFDAHAGLYALRIRYRAPFKGFQCEVNGLTLSSQFADSRGRFAEQSAGRVYLLEGANQVSIFGGWKLYDIDRIELQPLPALPSLRKPSARLCDPEAIPAAHALMDFLVENYGSRTLSGTIEGPDVDYVLKTTGKLPAIIAGDMMNINQTTRRYAGVISGETERLIERAHQGHIITYCWHWRPPSGVLDRPDEIPAPGKKPVRWYMSFYTHATTFDVEAVLAHPESPDYALMIADIDLVAVELRKLADQGIPVLWRPLHEAEGGWFWWGSKGPKPFVQLWHLLHERLTRVHKLHNLIWVYTGTATPEWYPGDDVVDIIGIDDYPSDVRDPLSAIWDSVHNAFGDRKLIALSEFGGVPDLPGARRLGVTWSYFASWSKDLGPMKMKPDVLKALYNDPQVINLDALPRDRWKPAPAVKPAL